MPLPNTIAPEVVWIDVKADVLLDTSAIGRAKDDPATRRRLIRRLNKLTERMGHCWIASETLTEIIRTPPGPSLAANASALLEIHHNVRDGLRVLDVVSNAQKRELIDRDQLTTYGDFDGLLESLATVARTGSLEGTPLRRALDQINEFMERHRPAVASISASWKKKYTESPTIQEEMQALLRDFREPQALKPPRALLEVVCEQELGWAPQQVKAELDRAQEHLDQYWCCWTWALLLVLHDLLETVPIGTRNKLDPKLAALRKPHENDLMDAAIVGAGARCGTLLTSDKGLHQRCALLYDRDLIGIAPDDLFS